MKLLQNSWSEMLILDQIHQRLHNHLPDETTLHNGQKFQLLSLALLGVPSMAETFQEIANKFTALKFDSADYVCLKFVLLLNLGEWATTTLNSSIIECFIRCNESLDYICVNLKSSLAPPAKLWHFRLEIKHNKCHLVFPPYASGRKWAIKGVSF